MTDRELMQHALEALIWTTGSDDFGDGGKAREGALKLLFPSITALREALAEQPAQQEPVAWMNILEDGYKCLTHNPIPNWTPLYTSPPAQQTCNCQWDGDIQVQCTLHEAHVAAIHEWAERAKSAEHKFKNFHRLLCERFGYSHDERDWQRDQLSLIEWIAKQVEQPAQQQEPEPDRVKFERHWRKTRGEKKANRELPRHPLQPQTYIQDSANRHWVTWQVAVRSVAPPPQRKPLTDEDTVALIKQCRDAFAEELGAWDIDPPIHHVQQGYDNCVNWLAAYGIKEKNT